MWGLTPLDQLACRIQFRRASYQGIYTPPEAARHSIDYLSYNGGSDSGSLAIDPQRGVMIANYNDMPIHVWLLPLDTAATTGWVPLDEGNVHSCNAEAGWATTVATTNALNSTQSTRP